MLTYIPVSFLFSFIFRVRVKNRVWVRVSFRLGLALALAFRFGIGNQIVIIGGAASTVDPCGRKTPVPCLVVYFGVFFVIVKLFSPVLLVNRRRTSEIYVTHKRCISRSFPVNTLESLAHGMRCIWYFEDDW